MLFPIANREAVLHLQVTIRPLGSLEISASVYAQTLDLALLGKARHPNAARMFPVDE